MFLDFLACPAHRRVNSMECRVLLSGRLNLGNTSIVLNQGIQSRILALVMLAGADLCSLTCWSRGLGKRVTAPNR